MAVSFGGLAEGEGGEVVGVVGDAQHDAEVTTEVMPSVYVSYRQIPVDYMSVALRSGGAAGRLAPLLRREVRELRRDVPLYDVTTLRAQISDATARTRVVLTLVALFAGAALLLAAVGLYGLTSFAVARRVREMGVRIALGAKPARVVRDVLGHTLRLAAVGSAVGLAGAWGITRLLEGLLYETAPRDPLALGGAAALLAAAALAAAWLPARRAAAVDPARTLRSE